MRNINKKENITNKRQERSLKELDVNLNLNNKQMRTKEGGMNPYYGPIITKK